jgi:hypothetical protein
MEEICKKCYYYNKGIDSCKDGKHPVNEKECNYFKSIENKIEQKKKRIRKRGGR